MRSLWRACRLLVALVPLASGAGCGEPDLASDLDTDGPPEVLQVNVHSESAVLGPGDPSGLQAQERATFCRGGTQYKVNEVYCPDARDSDNAPIPGQREVPGPVMDAEAKDWYVRIIFSELLDVSVEKLVKDQGVTTGHIAETRPVVLRCGGDEIDYDGYYDPSGNHLSNPPGPGLVVTPAVFVASGTPDCEVSVIDKVTDKDGNAVPSDQRGPYQFGIAPLAVWNADPADMSEGVALEAQIQVEFGAPIDLSTVETRIVLAAGATEVAGTLDYVRDGAGEVIDQSVIVLTPAAPLDAATSYTITISSGITDVAGGPLELDEPRVTTFTTVDA